MPDDREPPGGTAATDDTVVPGPVGDDLRTVTLDRVGAVDRDRWDLAPGAGTDLDGFIRCVSPWRLEDSALVAAPFDPATCAGLTSTPM